MGRGRRCRVGYSSPEHEAALYLRGQTCHSAVRDQAGRAAPGGRALAADHLVLVELARQDLQRWLDDAAAQAQHQVERRLCRPSHARLRQRRPARPARRTDSRRDCCSQPPRGRPSDGAHPSGCCSLPASGHPRAACRRKSGAAGSGGMPARAQVEYTVRCNSNGDKVPGSDWRSSTGQARHARTSARQGAQAQSFQQIRPTNKTAALLAAQDCCSSTAPVALRRC